MFNSSKKESFLEVKFKQDRNNFLLLFNQSSSFEEKWHCDLSEFSREQTIAFLDSFYFSRPELAKKYINFVKTYQLWGIADKSTAFWESHPITKNDLDFISGIKNSYFKDSNDFLDELASCIEFDGGYFVVPALCLAWLGFNTEEFLSLLKENVDLRLGKILKLDSKDVVKIDDPRILQTLRIYQNTSVSYRTQNQTFEVYPQTSPYFLRKMVTKNSKKVAGKLNRNNFLFDIMRLKNIFFQKTGKISRLEFTNVFKSGQLYRAYQAEKQGNNILAPESKDYFMSFFDNKGAYYDVVFLYQKYKETFSLR